MLLRFILCALTCSSVAWAEVADYGNIELTGLSRDVSWPLNEAGEANALVCNVNGPDGFLAIRSGPGTEHETLIKLERLAYVTVDTRERDSNWVRVVGTSRGWTPEGKRAEHEDYGVSGWAHDGYLCSYTDYADWDELYRNRPVMNEGATRMDCEWSEDGAAPFKWECEVLRAADGTLTAFEQANYRYVLTPTGPDAAQLERGFEGELERDDGAFVRSETDPDCWVGAESHLLCVRSQTHGDQQ